MSAINEFFDRRDPRTLYEDFLQQSAREMAYQAVLFVVTLALAFIFVFPFYWLIRVASLWPPEALIGETPQLFLDELQFYNFARVISEVSLLRYAMNSVIVSAMAIVAQLIFCSLAAYGLTKDFYGKRPAMAFVIAAMLVPFETIFLTDYLITQELGLIDTYRGLAIVVAVSIVNILVLHSAFEQVPEALADAARMDGASELYILFGVYWPVSKPALATVTILTGVFSWNMYLWPLVIVSSDSMATLPLALARLQGGFSGNFALQYAFSFLALLPLLIVFLLLQKYFIRSAVMSSIKT